MILNAWFVSDGSQESSIAADVVDPSRIPHLSHGVGSEQINVNVPRLTAARTTDTVGEAILARLASNGLLFPAPSSLLFEFIDIITNANPGPE